MFFYMTKTEARSLRVGSKYLYKSPFGYEKVRTVKFICWYNYRPMYIFYGASWAKRVAYDHLITDTYVLIKR